MFAYTHIWCRGMHDDIFEKKKRLSFKDLLWHGMTQYTAKMIFYSNCLECSTVCLQGQMIAEDTHEYPIHCHSCNVSHLTEAKKTKTFCIFSCNLHQLAGSHIVIADWFAATV